MRTMDRKTAGKTAGGLGRARALFSLLARFFRWSTLTESLVRAMLDISSRFPKINFIEVVLLIDPNLFKMGFLLFFRKLDDDKRNI